jgi:hypothetical protein
MPARARFDRKALAEIRDGKILGIRAGTKPHRIIGIWAVVVAGRVFVRSWTVRRSGWWSALRDEPEGVIQVGKQKLPFRAAFTRSERLRAAVDRAYVAKFRTPWAAKLARQFDSEKRRATTTELVPIAALSASRRRARPARA